MAEIQFMSCPEEAALIQLLNTVNDTSSIFPAPQIPPKKLLVSSYTVRVSQTTRARRELIYVRQGGNPVQHDSVASVGSNF